MKYVVEIVDPIYYLDRGGKRYYLNAQTYYRGVHWRIRSWIKDQVSYYLHTQFKNIVKFDRISLTIEFHSKKKNWDIDNKGYFWLKAVCDYIKGRIVEDDNVQYIDEVNLKYVASETEILKIIIDEKT